MFKFWCYIVRAQLLGERLNGKYSPAKQLNGPRGFEIVVKLGKCYLFRWIHTLSLFLLQAYSHLASETRTNLSTLHWCMGKNPLESYWGDYLVTFKGVIQLKLVNETITNKAYQDKIKSDIKLQYESRANILKRYCKVCCLVECFGYSAFIYDIYIEIGLEYGFIWKDDIFPILPQFQTLLAHLTVLQYCTYLLAFLLIIGILLCSIKFEHPKCT